MLRAKYSLSSSFPPHKWLASLATEEKIDQLLEVSFYFTPRYWKSSSRFGNCIFISFGCCNKLPQAWWFKTIYTYLCIVLEARSPKSLSLDRNQYASRTVLPWDALGENSFLASSTFWWLLPFIGLWPHHSSLCLCGHIPFSSSVSQISFCFLLKSTYDCT